MNSQFRSRLITAAALPALAVLTTPIAQAEIFLNALGNAAPPASVGGHTLIAFPLDNADGIYRPGPGSDVSNAPGPLGSVTFNVPHNHRRIGAGWTVWGHGYTGDVYFADGPHVLTLPPDTTAFVFYLAPETAGQYSTQAVVNGVNALQQLGTQALGFSVHATGGDTINTIELSSSRPTAIGEFSRSIPQAELHVSSPMSKGGGCYEFDLAQYAGEQGEITQVVAELLSPDASITAAGGQCNSPIPPEVTTQSATWQIPGGLNRSYPDLEPTCRVTICLSSSSPDAVLRFSGGQPGLPPGGSATVRTIPINDSDIVIPVRPRYPTGCDNLYTLDADFDKGTLLSVNHNAPNSDQLQVSDPAVPFPYLAVACSARGTIVRIDVNTGTVVGEYRTAPAGFQTNPSRTTVDLFGNVWVGNRNEGNGNVPGSVTKVGLIIGGVRCNRSGAPGNYVFTPSVTGQYIINPTYNTCVDRDGDGAIKTSRGLTDILAWNNVTDGLGGGIIASIAQGGPALVQDAEDEAILVYQRTHAQFIRHVSIDANNDVWVGGWQKNAFDLLDGADGSIFSGNVPTLANPNCGTYGGLIDCRGNLWSATQAYNQTLRFVPPSGPQLCVNIPGSYGLGIDTNNVIWNTSFSTQMIYTIDPTGTLIGGPYPTGGITPTGVAVSPFDNDVWIANRASANIGRLNNTGSQQGVSIPVGPAPTGVFVDSNAKTWTTNLGSDNAMRMDPNSIANAGAGGVDMTVSLGSGAGPYNYSDGTGIIGLNATSGQGAWIVIQDSGTLGQNWGKITWNQEPQGFIPPGGSIVVEARASDTVPGLTSQIYIPVASGVSFSIGGRYIEVRATLKSGPGQEPCEWISPVLSDLRIECCAAISKTKLICKCPGPGYTMTFDLTNYTGFPIGWLFFQNVSPSNVTITPVTPTQPLGYPIAPGTTRPINLMITGPGAVPGATVCFDILMTTAQKSEVCRIRKCITLPDCQCAQLRDVRFTCTSTPGVYIMQFRIQNLWGPTAYHMLLFDTANLLSFSPSYLPVPRPGGATPFLDYCEVSGWLTTTITGPPGPRCFNLALHSQNWVECCYSTICITLPVWGEPGYCCFPCLGGYTGAPICSREACAAIGGIFQPTPCGPPCQHDQWHGATFVSLGSAVARVTPGDELEVRGIGSSGNDGVEIRTDDVASLQLDFAPIDPVESVLDGAFLRATATGCTAGLSNRPLATVVITNDDIQYTIATDATASGATTHTLLLFSGGALVASGSAPTGLVATAAAWPSSIEAGDDGGALRWILRYSSPTLHRLGQAPPVAADELHIVSENGDLVECITALQLTAADIEPLVLLDAVVTDFAQPADLDCNGTVDFFDIDPFLLALFDPTAYAAAHPGCNILNGDVNGDGALDFFDIDPFLLCLFSGCP